MGCECVVFSPARRASRKLLERMVRPRPLFSWLAPPPRPPSVFPVPPPCTACRASRVCGARQIEFVRLLGYEPLEYNQEQARVMSFDGKASIIRSFPYAAARAPQLPCNRNP